MKASDNPVAQVAVATATAVAVAVPMQQQMDRFGGATIVKQIPKGLEAITGCEAKNRYNVSMVREAGLLLLVLLVPALLVLPLAVLLLLPLPLPVLLLMSLLLLLTDVLQATTAEDDKQFNPAMQSM